MIKVLLFILVSSFSFSTLSFANDACSGPMTKSQNALESIYTVTHFFKLPKNFTGVRLTASLANPPADISIQGNEVVIQSTEDGNLQISVRTANFVGEETDLGNGQIIPRSGSSIETQVLPTTLVNIQDNSLTLSSDGKNLSVTRVKSIGRPTGSFMFLVTITDVDTGNELSAYVMSAF